MDSAHKYALIEYRNKLKRQRNEIDERLSAINFLLSESTIIEEPATPQSSTNQIDFSKLPNEQWVDYVFRILQGLGKAKTNDIVNEIIKYNPSQERESDSLRKTVNRCWRELRETQKVSVIEGKVKSEGNTYYPKNK